MKPICLFRLFCLAMLAPLSLSASAQRSVGDFIESKSNNEAKRGVQRVLQYRPEGDELVCWQGKNRYTRALYGGYTDYRVETSDVPIFAVFKKGHHRNIRFRVNGVPLETVEKCRAGYLEARRSYSLADGRWDGAGRQTCLSLEVQALHGSEGAIFRFATGQASSPLDVETWVCAITDKVRMRRNGDMGADPAGVFAPHPANKNLVVSKAVCNSQRRVAYVVVMLDSVAPMPFEQADKLWAETLEANRKLASRVRFTTPDPYLNPLGGALAVAADGDWDGKTWLHGCVGWRMPLAGWRASYLGDVLGWPDRARSHFDAYAKSQVTDVPPIYPHPSQDPKMNMARAEKKWGTQMYSNGYICRNPERNNQMHHYDMNLNYMDELLWHFQYDADTAYMRKMWPVITAHLAWEKRNFDPDNDHLYDAYCCIWASDALYYSGGAVTHSSAYNYRGNLLAARIAELIGENPEPYRREAEAIAAAMNSRLWLEGPGHWGEYQDLMGLRRVHESAALWSVYTPIDCGVGTPEQWYRATCYVDTALPHIPVVTADGRNYGSTVSTSNWMPYAWSINNVAAAEVMHTALAYFEAGRSEDGYKLMMANIMDQMYIGDSPANFGQLSFYDAARGECYRDFGDCIGISARTLIQGLFGVVPDALHGRLVIRPGFPAAWDSAAIHTPYLDYRFNRVGGKAVYEVTQRMARPLTVVIRQNLGEGRFRDVVGSADLTQRIEVDLPVDNAPVPVAKAAAASLEKRQPAALCTDLSLLEGKRLVPVCMDGLLNAGVSDIFNNEYRSPRPPYTTLQLPVQGMGEWCHPTLKAEIDDSLFRSKVSGGVIRVGGVPFRSPAKGHNIAYTSLFDNYPDSIELPLKGRASGVALLIAGSTNHMQSRIANALVTVTYADGTADTLRLVNPDNWCPIEQDYYVDGKAFSVLQPRPLRFCFGKANASGTGVLESRDLGRDLGITEVYGRLLPGGAGQLLALPLDPSKRLRLLRLRTLSNDVVVGLMAATLVR